MSRRNRATKREILPDSKYNNLVVAKAINTVMWDGKKEVAENIVYSALEKLKKVAKDQNELAAFLEVVDVLKPVVEVRSRRVGGATYQVPVEVRKERQQTLALRWLVEYSRKRSERSMEDRLFAEMRDALNGQGAALKKKVDTHKMAEANKAFAHFRW
ncbi:MAG: 30S ribosomal protein S7 [Alphaproteobacteria bacterium]|jgi:small subunit ribosomal protein S7|nr:30S ribosomal protein S7 [Alphaproteobacteria bacterium]